ncbi:tumor necrosis factor receptor superfamily member 26-like isoform X2 [Ranitomeya imitator]
MNGKIVCLKCPAGYFVKKDCVISYTQGICKMCNPGENYSAHETGLNSCLTCTKCRADQEEISYCNITKNTVCRCRKGTYCPTNSTSTQCLPCRSSCPEKQVLQQTCNSTSDIVCVPVTPDPTVYYILVSFGILVPAVIIGICAWFFCRKSGDGLIRIRKVFTKCLRHKADSEEDAKEQFLQQENKLYMTNYLTKDEVIASTFSIFVALVPSRVFKKFVLELGLTKNEINLIKQDIRATEEQHYAMLSQLHRNQKFDVNIWLRKLAFIKLDNVAQEICTRLIEDELFERSI